MDTVHGLATDGLITLDKDVPELEQLLCRGGYSEDGYDYTELLDIEILPKPTEGENTK